VGDYVQAHTCLGRQGVQVCLQRARARRTGITYLDSVKTQYSIGSRFLIIQCAFWKGVLHKLWWRTPGFRWTAAVTHDDITGRRRAS